MLFAEAVCEEIVQVRADDAVKGDTVLLDVCGTGVVTVVEIKAKKTRMKALNIPAALQGGIFIYPLNVVFT
jgi:hypothetical protein